MTNMDPHCYGNNSIKVSAVLSNLREITEAHDAFTESVHHVTAQQLTSGDMHRKNVLFQQKQSDQVFRWLMFSYGTDDQRFTPPL